MKKLLLSALAVVAGFSAYATDYELVTGSDGIEVGKNYLSLIHISEPTRPY